MSVAFLCCIRYNSITMRQCVIEVSGNVQGVFFRDFTRREAERLRITGWVKNELDGSVTIVAQGGEAFLKKFIARVRQGPPRARVDFVSVRWEESKEAFPHFEIVR